jgi:hypothetical protein
VLLRETREGWPLLTVETEANGVSKSRVRKFEKVLLLLVLWACHAGTTDFYPALAALVSLVQKLFSSPQTFSLY